MFEIETFNFCLGHFETLKLKLYDDVVSQSAFFSKILGLLQVELLVWMVCDRLICKFGIIGVRMNVGIDQPCTRSLKGHVVLRGIDLCCCCVRCRAERSVANSFRVGCLYTFFFPRRSLIYVGTCKVQMFYKNLLFSIRGFM